MKLWQAQTITCGIAAGFVSLVLLLWLNYAINGSTRCKDGWHSMSIGSRGTWSHHGGVGETFLGTISLPAAIGIGWYVGHLLNRKIGPAARQAAEPQIETPSPLPNAKSGIQCPKCDSLMQEKIARKGRYAGRKFLGCARYPVCTGIRSI